MNIRKFNDNSLILSCGDDYRSKVAICPHCMYVFAVDQPQWTPTDQYDTIGLCWVKYKGSVRHAWRRSDGIFMFSEHGMNGCFMTECISGVIAIEVPEL